jgi:hypothetical protein
MDASLFIIAAQDRQQYETIQNKLCQEFSPLEKRCQADFTGRQRSWGGADRRVGARTTSARCFSIERHRA